MSVKRILICGDSHGNHIDLRAREAILAFKADFKPDALIHLGDALDLAAMRRGASQEDMGLCLKQDFDEGCSFLREFFKGKAKEKHFIWGNHDQRLIDCMGSANAIVAGHAETLYLEFVSCLNRCGVKATDNFYDSRKGVVDLYPFRFVHGYSAMQNAAKFHAEKYGGSCPAVVFGHTHYRGYWRDISFDKREGYACSCMCDIDPSYASRHASKLRHSIGWLSGWYNEKTGEYQLNPVEGVMKGKKLVFITGNNIKEY